MILHSGKCRGFTLIELLVVVGMIAVILGAITTSVSSAQARARISKAKSDVKVISQAILSYEKMSASGELPQLDKKTASTESLSFLFGGGGMSKNGQKIPVLLQIAVNSSGVINDPWGHPYLVNIKQANGNITFNAASQSMETGFYLPNLYRLAPTERNLWTD